MAPKKAEVGTVRNGTTPKPRAQKVERNNGRYCHKELAESSLSKQQGTEQQPVKTKVVLPNRKQCRFHIRRPCRAVARFSVLVSTDQRNGVSNEQYFGPYSHIRKELDYSYHTNYQKERQWLQDSIIEDMLEDLVDPKLCITPTEPWLVFTVGVQGAGKKHTMTELSKDGKLPLLSFISVDQDEIRRHLPEYGTYLKRNPFLVEPLTMKECGYIAEIVCLAALQAGRNVVVDGTLRNFKWEIKRIEKLRKIYPCLKIGAIHVTAQSEITLKRRKDHGKITGRQLSDEVMRDQQEDIPRFIAKVRPTLDAFYHISNDDYIELETECDWMDFTRTFLQSCAWMPGMRGKTKMTRNVSNEQKKEVMDNSAAYRMRRRRKRFSVLVSSEENNSVDNDNFYGKFSHIRKTLDYSYHNNYTFERQKLQDAIISDMLESAIVTDVNGQLGTVPTEPWIVFTAGAMGAGKGYTMEQLVQKARFPLPAFVTVDPDEIRRLLPEYPLYIEENPELAGDMTRKEAGFIAEILTLAALQAGKNVLQDGSLRDSDWYKVYFARLRKDFHHLRQAILHVTAPPEAVYKRAAERGKITGRIVPKALLEQTMKQVPKSVKILAPLVDYYAELHNAPDSPDIKLLKPDEATWESFTKVWNQTVAYVPQGRKFAEKAKQLEHKGTGLSDTSTVSK